MTKVDKKCVQNIKHDVKNIVLSMPGNEIGGFCNELPQQLHDCLVAAQQVQLPLIINPITCPLLMLTQ